jgi:NADPH:quinone reductase-like Zn-dependent oxidoreductase
MIAQHELLYRVAYLFDAGTIRSTLTTRLSPISAATLTRAHEMVEEGHMVGKVVVAEPLE